MVGIISKKATAVWLVENTSLTFQQIADFCELTLLDIQTIADGQYEIQIGLSPIINGQLTEEEIKKCQDNPSAKLQLHQSDRYVVQKPLKSKSTTKTKTAIIREIA